MKNLSADKTTLTVYRWAGAWGPWRIKIPCGECSLTGVIINDVLEHELAGIAVERETRDWLSHWWEPLPRGGWHAPIVMVDGRVISQGKALNRGLLVQAVIEAWARKTTISGNHLFGMESCPYCRRAKARLEKEGLEFSYHDVVSRPRALYEMLTRVKPLIGPKTPVTVPQIWLDGRHIGGADDLEEFLK